MRIKTSAFLLLLTLLAGVASVRAQFPISDKVVVGESNEIGTFQIYDPWCVTWAQITHSPYFSGEYVVGSDTSTYDNSIDIPVYFSPNKIGVYIDSVTINLNYGSNGRSICSEGGPEYLQFTAIGISDSIIRVRPRISHADLYSDDVNGGWVGTWTQQFDNNVNAVTTFSNWSLPSDSTNKFSLVILSDSLPVTSYNARPLERWHPLTYQIRCKRARSMTR